MIALGDQPFSLVENTGLHRFVPELVPSYLLLFQLTFSHRVVSDLYWCVKQLVGQGTGDTFYKLPLGQPGCKTCLSLPDRTLRILSIIDKGCNTESKFRCFCTSLVHTVVCHLLIRSLHTITSILLHVLPYNQHTACDTGCNRRITIMVSSHR